MGVVSGSTPYTLILPPSFLKSWLRPCSTCAGLSPCKAKIQQGADKAAELTKIVNDLRTQHVNQSIPPGINIQCNVTILPVSTEEPLPSNQIDSLGDSNPQSRLGKRKVPSELPCTPEVSKMPKIIGDVQEGTLRKRLSYETPPTGAAMGATPLSVIKVAIEVNLIMVLTITL